MCRALLSLGFKKINGAKSLTSRKVHIKQSLNVEVAVIEIIAGCHERMGNGHLFQPKGVRH